MVKGLFAGLAGLSAAVAVLQLEGDGGAGSSGGTPQREVPLDAGAAAAPETTVSRDAGDAAVFRDARDGGGPAPAAPFASGGRRVTASRDGGPVYVGDAPGRIRAEGDLGPSDGSVPDGGIQPDGGSQADGGGQADELRRLRERVGALEQELARARSEAQVQELDRLNRQVADLRAQLAQEQARRQSEELAARQARAREQEAVTALSAAQQQLAVGDSRVLETLEAASGSLPAPAQSAVQSARAAVQSGDLSAARYWLSIAISQAQRRELSR